MNANGTGSSETVYFELTDLRLHIRTTMRNDLPVHFAKVCVEATAGMSRCRMSAWAQGGH